MLFKFNKIIIDGFNNLDDSDFFKKYGFSWFFNFFLFLLINSFLGGVHYEF